MSGVLFLTSKDFHVEKGSKSSSLCHKIQGPCLVMFYADKCEGCKSIKPFFQQLPQKIPACRYAMVNVPQNAGLVPASKDTSVPLKYVPMFILYFNGKPFLQYDDDVSEEKLVEFVNYTIQILKEKKPFSEKTGIKELAIPEYSLGIPYNLICDDPTRCYLTLDKAYGKDKKQGEK